MSYTQWHIDGHAKHSVLLVSPFVSNSQSNLSRFKEISWHKMRSIESGLTFDAKYPIFYIHTKACKCKFRQNTNFLLCPLMNLSSMRDHLIQLEIKFKKWMRNPIIIIWEQIGLIWQKLFNRKYKFTIKIKLIYVQIIKTLLFFN